MQLIINWIMTAIAIIIVAYLLPGVTLSGVGAALIAAVVLALVNVLVKPLLVALTLPVTVYSLGLFLLVINALVVWLVSAIVPGFQIAGFWWAVLFGIVMAVVGWALEKMTGADVAGAGA